MEAFTDATLVKWGNSQGLRIPKDVCDMLGIGVGSKARIIVDAPHSTMTLQFEQPQRKYHRSRKVSMEELCEGWSGGKVGEEWAGSDVGAEVVE